MNEPEPKPGTKDEKLSALFSKALKESRVGTATTLDGQS